ncbi:MAG TPA: hypothetical protein VKH45_15345, partial [Candidatus Acidoferrum sp.]|nr:hypothetical protein [Candidatus Acidoferrum sp.]
MNTKKVLVPLSIAALLLSGCEKSAPPNNMQSATPQQTPAQAPDANSTANSQPPGQNGQPGQAPMQTQNAAAPEPTPPPPPPQPVVIPAGTSVPIFLGQKVDSRVDDAGQQFNGTLATSISIDGQVAIPKGSAVSGVITRSKKQGTFKGEADLALMLTSINANGKVYPISSSTWAQTVKGKGKRTGIMTGGTAAAGALIGGLAGGGKGAAIGAGVGAGGGLAASGATGGENVTLQPETRLNFKLTKSLT